MVITNNDHFCRMFLFFQTFLDQFSLKSSATINHVRLRTTRNLNLPGPSPPYTPCCSLAYSALILWCLKISNVKATIITYICEIWNGKHWEKLWCLIPATAINVITWYIQSIHRCKQSSQLANGLMIIMVHMISSFSVSHDAGLIHCSEILIY